MSIQTTTLPKPVSKLFLAGVATLGSLATTAINIFIGPITKVVAFDTAIFLIIIAALIFIADAMDAIGKHAELRYAVVGGAMAGVLCLAWFDYAVIINRG